MATVLRFPVPPSGDWSPSERARLDELAARFAEQSDVEVVFGRSDSGDPWCVVLDAQDEVLIHVARERGGFVAHAAAPDVFVRSTDLRTAVDRVLGSRWLEERGDVVVPFASGSRAVQMLTAVLIVGSFVEHHRAEAEPVEDWVFAAARPLKPGARDGQRDDAAKVAVAADATPIGGHQPGGLPGAPAATDLPSLPFGLAADPLVGSDTPTNAFGGPGRELAARLIATSAKLEGTTTAEILVGTAGEDWLDGRGAPSGQYDLLDAGAGNDRLLLDRGAIAIGGDGADQFIVRAPEAGSGLSLLGIIVDFDPAADRLIGEGSGSLTVVATLPTRNIFGDPNLNLAPAPALPGAQIIVDIDGDGRGDGYLLVNSIDPGIERLEAVRQVVAELNTPPPTSIAAPATDAQAPGSPAANGERRSEVEASASAVAPGADVRTAPSAPAPEPEVKAPPAPVALAAPGGDVEAPSPTATLEVEPATEALPSPNARTSVAGAEAPPPSNSALGSDADGKAPPPPGSGGEADGDLDMSLVLAANMVFEAGAPRSIESAMASTGIDVSPVAIMDPIGRADMPPTSADVI